MDLIVDIAVNSSIYILFFVLVILYVASASLIRFFAVRIWMRWSYPDQTNWPQDAKELVYIPVAVDLWAYPLSVVFVATGAVGGLLFLLGDSTGVSAIEQIGRIILGISFAFVVSYVIGLPLGAHYLGIDFEEDRKKRSELAFSALKRKAKSLKDSQSEMKHLYRFWHTCYRQDRFDVEFEERCGKHFRIFRGYVLSKQEADRVRSQVDKIKKGFQATFENQQLSIGVQRFIERRIRRLEKKLRFHVGEITESATAPKTADELNIISDRILLAVKWMAALSFIAISICTYVYIPMFFYFFVAIVLPMVIVVALMFR